MFCSYFLFIFFKFKDLTVWYCYQARRQKSAMWGCYGGLGVEPLAARGNWGFVANPHLPEPEDLGAKPQPAEARGLREEPPTLKNFFLQK